MCGIRAGGDCMTVRGSIRITLRGWNGKEGKGNKDFKKGEQAGLRGGCL